MRRIFLFLCCFLLTAAGVFAADHYYYEDGQRIDVTPVDEYIVVLTEPNFTTWDALLASKPYLDENFEPFPVADGFMLLGVNTGYSSTAASADLRQTEGMIFANNVYEYPDGGGGTFTQPTIFISTLRPLQLTIRLTPSLTRIRSY